MRISIFGMGYVGVVSGACLAKSGHEVVGVDVSQSKVELIKSGRSPIVENGIDELIAELSASGRLTATTDAADVRSQRQTCHSSLSARPVNAMGQPRFGAIDIVVEQIGTRNRH